MGRQRWITRSLRGLALLVGAGIALTVGGSPASAAPVLGGQLSSTGGVVEVEVLPASAGLTSELWLFEPGPERFLGVTNRDIGTTVSVGTFPAGVELVFGIKAGGNTFKMGPASRNPDGVIHATVDQLSSGVANVGFEDLFGGGDLDYDDNVFQFRGALAPNGAPTANDDAYTVNQGGAILGAYVLANDTDPEGTALHVPLSSVTFPSHHGDFSFSSGGHFNYTPVPAFCGTDSFTYKASDGQLESMPATVTITVVCANRAPVANGDSYTTAEDTSLTVPAPGVLDNDSDVDGDALTAVLTGAPGHGGVALNADGSFVYTPAPNYCGTDAFMYRASDGELQSAAAATVAITIECVNDGPIAQSDTYVTNEDTALTVPAPGVLGNDSDIDGDALTVVSGANPDGSFTFSPATNFCGEIQFIYTISDGHNGTSSATVSITVNCVNDPPTAVNDAYTTVEETALTVPAPGVSGNDSDADGDSFTVARTSGPAHGTLVLNPDGSFTYTPSGDFSGTDTFTYTATDSHGGASIPATVTITVTDTKEATILDAKPIVAKLLPGITLYVVKLEATLHRADNGAPVVGKRIFFTIGSQTLCVGTTDASGVARCDGVFKNVRAALNIGYTATFYGGEEYVGAVDEGVIAIVANINII